MVRDYPAWFFHASYGAYNFTVSNPYPLLDAHGIDNPSPIIY